MQRVFPDYYKYFKCINSACRHNCCIGWEIDIDQKTAGCYSKVPGDFGQRLKENISAEEPSHFILGKDERCPFLNTRSLCDIIINLGEEYLCDICAEHPRFHNELPGRVESGLGLCCEAAASLILGCKTPVKLEFEGDCEYDDEIIQLRDDILSALQNRTCSLPERIERMLSLCQTGMPDRTITAWARFLLTLERLDEEWTRLLELLIARHSKTDFAGFDAHMHDRSIEYEQLTVYIIYRHFANAPDMAYTPARARLAALVYTLIHDLGAVIWNSTGSFTFDDQCELARLFSSEIEYSDENISLLLDALE